MTDRPLAIVTGGSRGIGRAVALRLAQDGYDIAFCYQRAGDAAASTAGKVRATGASCYSAPCDVSDLDAVQEFVAAAKAELGDPELLVNSAGILRDSPVATMDGADWSAVIDTNLTGTFNLCRSTVFDFIKNRRGCVVNISSVMGVYGNAGQSNYSAAKAGINGLTKAMAKEVARYGIRVNVVAPGFIETDMTRDLPEKVRESALAKVPLRRLGSAENVADLVSFLASDRASYITGQIVQVDGGVVI
ncbi:MULTISPECIES: 3-oxoacyl-[acyl-carrier-protein] reductase [unclassified Nocardiopsis]|uniref:3-oxoacyl-[acyl-carrier-protein] reductase n=1 Tax=unclassified Nocardiopsis TaxID=2649073 RepID=UPI001356E913|nr:MULTISPECIES: 3-oxoacyl-[acyl-carrier-protein] reductase [unclassified Nocardiopsis]